MAERPDWTRLNTVSEAFSPSAPIDQQDLFAGRINQLSDVMNAVNQKGQHAILFGERGVGKTSLATVISRLFGQHMITPLCGPVNCDPTMTFSSLWHKVFREITFSGKGVALGFTGKPEEKVWRLAEFLDDDVTPDDIRHLLTKLGRTLIVIDEFDRLTDTSATALMADTIKNLSDHAVDTTLLLVGVADSVEMLMGEHQSVERALVQVKMPRMSVFELHQIVDKGVEKAGMQVTPEAKNKIAVLSQGLPHYTHLLALHAAQHAITNGSEIIDLPNVRAAIDKALGQAQLSIISGHHKATSSPRENLYPQVLLACALAVPDSLGYFAASDVRGPMSRIMGKSYDIPAFSQHLNAFCEESRGPVLQRTGSQRRYRFRFVNPLLQPYVIMDGIKKGLINEEHII